MKLHTGTYALLVVCSLISCVEQSESEEQLEREKNAIDQHLTASGIADKQFVIYDNSGIRIVINSFGLSSPPPHEGQTVIASYVGKIFPEGTVFDSVGLYQKIEDITPWGLRYGISGLLKGTSATFYVPSRHGFGSATTGIIPANSTLQYDIVIHNIKRTSAEEQQYIKDSLAIQEYIAKHSIATTDHISGIRYSLEGQRLGIRPVVYEMVSFNYTMRKLSSPNTVEREGSVTSRTVFSQIDGLKLALPLLVEGNKADFYIPSVFTYGGDSYDFEAPNANLIVTLELTRVFKQ